VSSVNFSYPNFSRKKKKEKKKKTWLPFFIWGKKHKRGEKEGEHRANFSVGLMGKRKDSRNSSYKKREISGEVERALHSSARKRGGNFTFSFDFPAENIVKKERGIFCCRLMFIDRRAASV